MNKFKSQRAAGIFGLLTLSVVVYALIALMVGVWVMFLGAILSGTPQKPENPLLLTFIRETGEIMTKNKITHIGVKVEKENPNERNRFTKMLSFSYSVPLGIDNLRLNITDLEKLKETNGCQVFYYNSSLCEILMSNDKIKFNIFCSQYGDKHTYYYDTIVDLNLVSPHGYIGFEYIDRY